MITMPGPGATDPADLQAHACACAHLGLFMQLELTRRKTPHPSCSGRGYDTWFRREQLDKAAIGEDVDVSLSSIRQWRERLEPYRATGNKAREKIVGVDLINLVTFLRAWPESQLEEMAAFLYNKGGPLYLVDVISKRLLLSWRLRRRGLPLKPIKLRGRTSSSVSGAFLTAPPLSEFFRCPDASSLTSMSSGLRWRSATARGDGH